MATFPELTSRIESVKAYMLSAIRDLNNLILIAQKHKPTPVPGLHGLVSSFSGIKTSTKIVDDYQSIQEGLTKLKEKYQKVYPKEFSYLDEETIINMGCVFAGCRCVWRSCRGGAQGSSCWDHVGGFQGCQRGGGNNTVYHRH